MAEEKPLAAESESPQRAGEGWSPATSLVTWGLALVLLVVFDFALTRSDVLWGPTAFENSGGLRTVFPQTYQVLRKIYAPAREAHQRVALLGNSRLALSIEGSGVETAIGEQAVGRDVAVDNLAIFGAYVGDTAILARHLDVLDPDLVIVTVGGMELGRPATNPDAVGPMSLLEIGWRDGPVASKGLADRMNRWLRTIWPLYRFREFLREAILDDVLGRPDPGPAPGHFETRMDLFRHLYGKRAVAVHAAHDRFLADQSLENFEAFVSTVGPEHLKRQLDRVAKARPVSPESPAIVTLDWLLAELAATGREVIVLAMPENPILDLDVEGRLHRPDYLDAAAELARQLAARHGLRFVDARRWLPATVFLDFHHPLFEPQHFAELMAKEILDALDP